MDTIARLAKIAMLLLALSSASGTPIKDRPIVVGQKADSTTRFVVADEDQRIQNKQAETNARFDARIQALEYKVAKLEGGQ